MKTKIFYIGLLSIALFSCTKENERMSPGTLKITPFKVTADALEVELGEPVNFRLEGNADTVYFWSGEFGKDYSYTGGREVPVESPTLSIRTNSNYGTQESLSILLSQDFNGDYSYESITAANWKDMTSKFNIPKPTGATLIHYASPAIDISEFIEEDKPYYLAVRNNIAQSTTGNTPTQYYFYASNNTNPSGKWSFTGWVNGESVEISTFAGADWKVVVDGYLGGELDGTRGPRPSPAPPAAPTSLFLARNLPSTEAMDTWAVTKAFQAKVNLGPDKGTIIKRVTDLPLEEYKYTYAVPGEYNVAFTTINKDRTAHVFQFKVTVTP